MRALGLVTILAAGMALAAAPTLAGSVDPAGVTTFQNGQPADADELNTTLQALITAIDDNAARVGALETGQAAQDSTLGAHAGSLSGHTADLVALDGRVGALEGSPTESTLVGTWKLFGLEVEASGRDDDHAGWAGGYRIESTLTLSVDPGNGSTVPPSNDFTISDVADGTRVLISVHKFPCDPVTGPEGAQCVNEVWVADQPESDSESDTGTWSLDGNQLTLSHSGGDDTVLTLDASGNLLLNTYVEDDDNPDGGSIQRGRLMGLSVGVKLQ